MLLHQASGLVASLSSFGAPPPRAAAAAAAASTLSKPYTLPIRSIVVALPSLLHFDIPRRGLLFRAAPEATAVGGRDYRLQVPEDDDEEGVRVRELEDLPEQWRRSKVAWLCKELPSHKHSTLTRILNAQRKWLKQDDATYVVVHCLRIRENESAFRVYSWMSRQHWYEFDFALATKLADCLGKDRKFSKCREMFDEIIKRGRVPTESTFHVLVVAYLSAPVEGCLEEACGIYNKMIQLGGYRPRLSLHNSLFRALVSKPGVSSKHYLKQAEFIFHNLVTTGLEIQKDIYAGLVWLHSYQDVVDRERIQALREDMLESGFEESKDFLVSIMRACSKEGYVNEAEWVWNKLLKLGTGLPSQAVVYFMEVYSRAGEPTRSLDVFKGMAGHGLSPNLVAYQKIIEVMAKAQEIEITESLIYQLIESGLKPLAPSFVTLMDMYLDLNMHGKLEAAFSQCLSQCSPNRIVYNIYMDSLVRSRRLEKAEELFNEMLENGAIGTNARSCNIILGGFITSEDYAKAERIFDLMLQKKYDIETPYLEKIENVLSLKKRVAKKPAGLKLNKEQREMLIGLLLGGAQIDSDEQKKNHSIQFEFNENSMAHSVLKGHIHERFYEWLSPYSRHSDRDSEIPNRFLTVTHQCFSFFANQLWTKGKLTVPKLIHRWLSAQALAYWYMYAGFRTSSGDILLKLRGGGRIDVERIVGFFLVKSLECKVKRKGRVWWIGFQGDSAVQFWKMAEPYILDGIKESLQLDCQDMLNETEECELDCAYIVTDSDSDSNGDSTD